MFKILFFILTIALNLIFTTKDVWAIDDPLATSNNKFGIHILFTTELEKARELVNSNGGDWGYITIPIQSHDKDLQKWQKFMDDCLRLRLIPIIRIATENYYFDTSFWRKPTSEDILDFANFLNSLNWPVKNRYVIIFNEVNRADEWEGNPNPGEYAQILSYSTEFFKSLSDDFFIISAGLDNASANSNTALNEYNFMRLMDQEISGIFKKIDGLGSHSYPNPGFSTPPWIVNDKSISSFKFEKNLAFQLSDKNLPVFITETGWSSERLPENQIAQYFTYAFENVWDDKDIIAVTPFLLEAGTKPFSYFSFLDGNGSYNEVSRTFKKIPKTKGKPNINPQRSFLKKSVTGVSFKTFLVKQQYDQSSNLLKIKAITPFFKWLLRIQD